MVPPRLSAARKKGNILAERAPDQATKYSGDFLDRRRATFKRIEQLADFGCGQRAAQEIALDFVDALLAGDERELLFGFHSLDRHPQPKFGAQPCHAAQ